MKRRRGEHKYEFHTETSWTSTEPCPICSYVAKESSSKSQADADSNARIAILIHGQEEHNAKGTG